MSADRKNGTISAFKFVPHYESVTDLNPPRDPLITNSAKYQVIIGTLARLLSSLYCRRYHRCLWVCTKAHCTEDGNHESLRRGHQGVGNTLNSLAQVLAQVATLYKQFVGYI